MQTVLLLSLPRRENNTFSSFLTNSNYPFKRLKFLFFRLRCDEMKLISDKNFLISIISEIISDINFRVSRFDFP